MPLPSPFCDERNMNRRILRLENTARHGVIEFFIHNTTQPGEILQVFAKNILLLLQTYNPLYISSTVKNTHYADRHAFTISSIKYYKIIRICLSDVHAFPRLPINTGIPHWHIIQRPYHLLYTIHLIFCDCRFFKYECNIGIYRLDIVNSFRRIDDRIIFLHIPKSRESSASSSSCV